MSSSDEYPLEKKFKSTRIHENKKQKTKLRVQKFRRQVKILKN